MRNPTYLTSRRLKEIAQESAEGVHYTSKTKPTNNQSSRIKRRLRYMGLLNEKKA